MDESIPPGYFSPYTLETRAHWVPNPAGEPKYYLQLDERFTHVADEKIGKFGYDFADYMPWEFGVRAISPENCPCASTTTNYLAGGWYRDEIEPLVWPSPCQATTSRALRSAVFSTATTAGVTAISIWVPRIPWTGSSQKPSYGISCRVPGRTL